MRLHLAAFVAILTVTSPALANPAANAKAAAKHWLRLIDKGDYAQSWDDASSLFRSHVSKGKWGKMVKAVRTPLGAVVTRTSKAEKLTDSLPSVPDGHYAVIRYKTQFAHKHSAVETVTMQDVNGSWETVGYFIR